MNIVPVVLRSPRVSAGKCAFRVGAVLGTTSLVLVTTFTGLLAQSLDDRVGFVLGEWTGHLDYLDYGDDSTVVRLRTTMRSRVDRDGSAIWLQYRYTEPDGSTVTSQSSIRSGESADIIRFDGEWKIVAREIDRGDRGARLVLERSGEDNNRPAHFRLTLRGDGDRLEFRKEVRYEGTDRFFVRNAYRFVRTVAPADLEGAWTVDLRPTPDAEPYDQEFIVTEAGAGRIRGTFYGTPIEQGNVNPDWGALHFAFVTEDGSGVYHTTGVLRGERLEGTTHSLGRGFLSVWTATRRLDPER